MATKIKGLQQWCRRMTDGYPNVDIANFTTAWRDGLAFCAIIHRFRPDLIDFDSLNAKNVYENCKLAFEIAEKELDIPAFLEADDMARIKVPDKLSVITYVSQYYNYLNSLPQLGGPGVKAKQSNTSVTATKRAPTPDRSQEPIHKKAVMKSTSKENSKPVPSFSVTSPGADKCAICENKVYLMERLVEEGKLYHRSCFRHSDLSPTNKVYNRSPFLSPALKSPSLDKTRFAFDEGSNTSKPQSQDIRAGKMLSVSSDSLKKTNAATNLSASSRVDSSVGKHTLTEPDREDNKKSKMNTAKIESKSKNIPPRLDRSDDSLGFPLSGKEAKKLEKRRNELLGLEKQVSHTPTKRNVPLIFQKNDDSEKTKSVSSHKLSSSTVNGSPSNTNTHSTKSFVGISTTTNSSKDSTKLDTGKQRFSKLQELQDKFSENSGEKSIIQTPVARPRNNAVKKTELPCQQNVPKPTPRKHSDILNKYNVASSENQSKIKSKISSNLSDIKSNEINISIPANTSLQPPPLPSSDPPPRDSSPSPPPLPTSPPPSVVDSDPKKNHQSQATIPSVQLRSIKTSLQPTNRLSNQLTDKKELSPKSMLADARSNLHTTKTPDTSEQKINKPFIPNTESSITPSKIQDQSKQDEQGERRVLSGLLASLAGVRKSSSSTPSPTNSISHLQHSSSSTSPTLSPVFSSIKLSTSSSSFYSATSISTASSSTFKTVSSSSALSTPISHTTTAPKVTSSITPQLKKSQQSKITVSTKDETSKHSDSVLPEALNVLSKLKPVKTPDSTNRENRQVKTNDHAIQSEQHESLDNMPKRDFVNKFKLEDHNTKDEILKMKQNSNVVEPKFKKNSIDKKVLNSPCQDHYESNKDTSQVTDLQHSKKNDNSFNGKPLFGVKLANGEMKNKSLKKDSKNLSKNDSLEVVKTQSEGTKSSESAIESNNSDLPQWKKDIEMRKKKLKDDIARSETDPKKSKYIRDSYQGRKDKQISAVVLNHDAELSNPGRSRSPVPHKLTSEDLLSQKSCSKANVINSETSTTEKFMSDSSKTPISPKLPKHQELPESPRILENSKHFDSLEITETPRFSENLKKTIIAKSVTNGGTEKLDWQLEAERRMSALLDSSTDESDARVTPRDKISPRDERTSATEKAEKNKDVPKKPARLLPPTPAENISVKSKNESHKQLGSDTSMEPTSISKHILKSKEDHNIHNSFTDIDDNQQHLKPVNKKRTTESDPTLTNGDYFQNVIRDLKPVTNEHKTKNTSGYLVDMSEKVPHINNNNNAVILDEIISDKKSNGLIINHKIDNVSVKENKNNILDPVTPKRKITVVASVKNRKAPSPPSSPTRKKIEISSKFNFEESDDLSPVLSLDERESETESKISFSTAQLTIEDHRTPPSRPPPPTSTPKTPMSPGHISAMELQQQLMDIDHRLTDLELRGRDLEDSIRNDLQTIQINKLLGKRE